MFTPSHLGLGIFLGALTLNFFNFWAVLLGSFVADLEPIFLVISRHCYKCPHHGFLHSILGAILGSLILALVLWLIRDKLNKLSLKIKIRQSFSFGNLFFSSLFGWVLHVFFDSFTHNDVFLFWPLQENPLLIGKEIYWPLTIIFSAFGFLGIFILYKRIKAGDKMKV